jgi:serine/threonine protein kinase
VSKIPDRIGKYEVIRRLGYGGMGTVYLARDPDLDRLLAIKVLRDLLFEDELVQRFLREARAAGNLRHENIITVYDAGQHDHQPFMAMEYVDGTSLAEIVRTRQPLALADKLSYLEQICAGLHHAHGQGIVHRDIKPANLMVDRRHVIRILDFGIARVEGSGMTKDGALMGTLNYMSPEQMLGRPIDHRSDIFAFGAVAYELIAYERAFPGTLQDGLLQRLPHEPPRPLASLCPGLPDELEPIVLRALAKLPQDRFADLEEARIAFRQIRRQLDPDADVEPITPLRRSSGGGLTPTPGSPSDRHEFLERRTRQVAYHRDAARTAFQAQDLDAAAAACEDALTLDPDDREAQQLLAEIEIAREQRGLESKEKRERERTIRRHLADADLKLSKGDVTTAARLLEQALTLDPANPAALALKSRLDQSASGGPVVAPTVVRPRARSGTGEPPGGDGAAASSSPADGSAGRSTRRPMLIAAAAGALALVAIVLWGPWRDAAPEAPASAVTGANENATTATTPDGRVPAVPRPNPSPAAPPPPAATASPAAVSAPVVATDRTLQEQLARATATYRRGDLAGALAEIRAVLARTNDEAARTLARTIAVDARRDMTNAADAARTQQASDRSPGVFATAERARELADRAFRGNDFVEAGNQALLAAANYSLAEREAIAAARAASAPAVTARGADAGPGSPTPPPVSAPAAAAPPPAANTNAGVSPNVPAVTPAPTPAPAAVTATPPPPSASPAPAAAAARALDVERAGILGAIGRYQNAYRERSVKALKAVYPGLPREMEQQLGRAFSRDCRAYDFAYLNPSVAFTPDDPTAATVTALTTYTCQPRSGQAAAGVSGQEVFMMRKAGDTWVIERALMDERAR